MAMMTKIEGNVGRRLRYWDDALAQGVGNPGLVEDVRILIGEIANDNVGFENQAEHILDDRGMLPNVFRPQHPISGSLRRLLDGAENRLEASCERGHHSNEAFLDAAFGDFKDARGEGNSPAFSDTGRQAPTLFTVILGDVLSNDVEVCAVDLNQSEQNSISIAGVVWNVEAEAAQETVMPGDNIQLTCMYSKRLPVFRIETFDSNFRQGDDALANLAI
nr:hypothetical protein [Paracoccus sp. SM22M-07]